MVGVQVVDMKVEGEAMKMNVNVAPAAGESWMARDAREMKRVKQGSVTVGKRPEDGASRSFFGVEEALVEEVVKRRLAGKRRLAAERRLVARAEADGEPNRAVKRLLIVAQFLPAAQRRLAAKRML